jgi:chromosome segregation ATPase
LDLATEFPFIGYTYTENFTAGEHLIKPISPETNPPSKEMQARIELLEKENKALLKVNQEQYISLNELYPLKEQIKQLYNEHQTLLAEKTSIFTNLESKSKELEGVKMELKKKTENASIKEQQYTKQLTTLKNNLNNQSHQKEHFLHLEKENASLLEALKESKARVDELENELRQIEPKEQKPNVKSTPEAQTSLIAAAMWERDQKLIRSLQNALDLSETKLSRSNLQVHRLKKEIQHFQKGKLERKKTASPKKQVHDIMEGKMKLSFESNSFKSFYLKLHDGKLEILDEENQKSKSILDLR